MKIKEIFTNLLFVLGVILMVVGFVKGVSVVAKSIIFDKYPLDSYKETECDLRPGPRAVLLQEEVAEPLPEGKNVENKQKCLEKLEQSRQVEQVEDITSSISILVSGIVLVLAFKRFIFAGKLS